MFNRKHMFILLIFIIACSAITTVSAIDVNATDDIITDTNNVIGDVSKETVSVDVVKDESVADVSKGNVAVKDVDVESNVSNEKLTVSKITEELKTISEVSGGKVAIAQVDDEIITSDSASGTFNDLQSMINRASSGGTITLYADFYYDADVDDSNLKSGLDLRKDLTINGNGHFIYGNGARIMWVYSGYTVLVSNLDFYNMYDDELILGDEDFSGYKKGGAIYNNGLLYLQNCEFYFNLAFEEGGAIYNSEDGLLMVNGCIFANSTLYNSDDTYAGGAIASYGSLYVIDSGFLNNYGGFGGAIGTLNEAYIVDSVFRNNNAYTSGGAIFNYMENVCHVSGCNFYGNEAIYGGAVYNSIAINCYFDKYNIASSYGHDMRNGVAISCTSQDSYSNNFYGTIISTGFSFNPENLIYTSGTNGKTFDVVVTSNPNGEEVQGVNVVLNIDGDDSNETVTTDSNGVASFSLSSLTNGIHTFSVNLKYQTFNDTVVDYNVVVGKLDSSITASNPIAYEYGGSGSTTVTLDGCTINQAQVLNYPAAQVMINGNTITVSGLDAGSYTLHVTTTPDEIHTASQTDIPITVNQIESTMQFSNNQIVFNYGDSGFTSVTLDGCTLSQAYVVNNPTAMVQLNGNMITVSGLNAGTYTLQVNTAADKNHKAATGTIPVTVNKVASTVTFNGNAITFDYLKSGYVTFTVTGGSLTRQNVYVIDHVSDAKVDLSGNMITVSGLGAGNYILHVETTPDANHNSAEATLPIVVNKVYGVLNANKLTTIQNSGASWTIKLTDTSGMAIANTNIVLNVYTGSSYVPYTVTTDAQGIATFAQASTLSIGTHTVTASVSDNNLNVNPLTSSIVVNKKADPTVKLKMSVKRESINGGTALTVFVKQGSKNVKNGIKIKLTIKKGSKTVKKVTLKTKLNTQGKSIVGYATNKLPKGKYSAVFQVKTKGYAGTKKSQIVIKKKGKWEMKA